MCIKPSILNIFFPPKISIAAKKNGRSQRSQSRENKVGCFVFFRKSNYIFLPFSTPLSFAPPPGENFPGHDATLFCTEHLWSRLPSSLVFQKDSPRPSPPVCRGASIRDEHSSFLSPERLRPQPGPSLSSEPPPRLSSGWTGRKIPSAYLFERSVRPPLADWPRVRFTEHFMHLGQGKRYQLSAFLQPLLRPRVAREQASFLRSDPQGGGPPGLFLLLGPAEGREQSFWCPFSR